MQTFPAIRYLFRSLCSFLGVSRLLKVGVVIPGPVLKGVVIVGVVIYYSSTCYGVVTVGVVTPSSLSMMIGMVACQSVCHVLMLANDEM